MLVRFPNPQAPLEGEKFSLLILKLVFLGGTRGWLWPSGCRSVMLWKRAYVTGCLRKAFTFLKYIFVQKGSARERVQKDGGRADICHFFFSINKF